MPNKRQGRNSITPALNRQRRIIMLERKGGRPVIEYINPNRAFTGEAYDDTYRHDPDRFGHTVTFRALEHVFDRWLKLDRPIKMFDLGCGQGQVISYMRDVLKERAPQHLNNSAFYGIDISQVAIEQCEAREPEARWVADSFQDFLNRPETAAQHGTFDLVINKGGLTAVRSADDYRAMLDGVRKLLRDGGIYLFVQHKQFYQIWSNEHCADWDTDIFELADDTFGPADRIDDVAVYICVFHKGDSVPASPTPAKPRRISFRMNDRSEHRVFVAGDEMTVERLRRIGAKNDTHERITFNTSDESGRDKFRLERARDDFQPGRPSLLIGAGRVRMSDSKAIDPIDDLYQAFNVRCNVVVGAGMIATTRHLCKAAPQWSLARPNSIVIGPGLEDFKRPNDPALPLVDPDEFRYRLDWALDVLVGEAKANVVYIATPPVADFVDARNGYFYRREDGLLFARIAAEVCDEQRVKFDDASQYIIQDDSRSKQSQTIAERAAALLNIEEHAACTR